MSAFVVSDAHIAYLLAFAHAVELRFSHGGQVWDCTNPERLAALGGALLNANQEAVNARYAEDEIAPPRHWPRPRGLRIDPVQALKALDCYEYQAAELPTWPDTLAAAFVGAMRASAVRALPGYEEAAWHIDSLRPRRRGAG
jgi:hypothetical protein